MSMSKVPSRGEPEFCIIPIRTLGAELGEAVSSIQLGAHKGAKSNGFGGYAGKDIKRMGRDNVREVRDYSNAVPDIRSLVGRCVNGWGGKRKSRGRFRT
jgi:hypothetical protein